MNLQASALRAVGLFGLLMSKRVAPTSTCVTKNRIRRCVLKLAKLIGYVLMNSLEMNRRITQEQPSIRWDKFHVLVQAIITKLGMRNVWARQITQLVLPRNQAEK